MKEKHVLQWHITHKCNLRCSHCYQDEYLKDLDIHKLKDIFYQYLDFINYYNFKGHINFTGGEPFIYKHIFDLFDLCEEHSITFGILTNGTILTEEILLKLKKYKKLSFIQVSLDGIKSTHESIRGAATFDTSLKALKQIRKAKIQTMVAFTCHKDNYKEIPKLIKIIKRNKIDRFWVDRLIPLGDESKEIANKNKILSTDEYRDVIKILTKERQKAKNNPLCKTTIHTNRALQFCEGSLEYYTCSAGIKLLTLLANGDILPCRRLPIPFGNVLENTILELYQKSDLIKDLKKENIPTECMSCLNASVCKGGAKCLSYALFKNYTKKDYNCYF